MSGRSRERDEARRERDEQVALRDEEREAANAAFKAADAERETHLATIRNKDREIASLKARLRGAAVSDENVESEVEEPAAKRKEAATNAAKQRPTKRKKTAAGRDAESLARLEASYVGVVFNDESVEGVRKVVRIQKAGSGWTAVAVLLDDEDDEAPYPVEALDALIRAFVPPRPKQMASGDEVPPPPRQSPRRASAAPAPAPAAAPIDVDVESRSAPAGRSPRSEPPPPGDQSMDVEPPAAAAPTPAPSETPIDVAALDSDDGAPAPAAAEPAVAFTGPDLSVAERQMVEFVLRREPKDSVISMKTLRREVEMLLGAQEDALKVKKGAIEAFLRKECVPRGLATMPRIVDDEDDD